MGMERSIVTAVSLLSELFEEALAADLDDLSVVDTEVVLDEIDAAGRHITNALFLHRPDLRKLPPERRVPHLDRLFARYPVSLDGEDIATMTVHAYEALDPILGAKNPAVRHEADFAMSHLDVVLLVLDPDIYSRMLETASAADRVRIAAQAEQAELMLEEARAMICESAP